jgi:hypothetical protein
MTSSGSVSARGKNIAGLVLGVPVRRRAGVLPGLVMSKRRWGLRRIGAGRAYEGKQALPARGARCLAAERGERGQEEGDKTRS